MAEDNHRPNNGAEDLRWSYDKQQVLNALLSLSLEDIPLQELLQRALDLLTTISWIALEAKGGIFLAEYQPEVLVLQAQNGLAGPILAACGRVPFGKCLCGLAASTRQIQFATCLDERHVIHYEGIAPHGHYCIPILFGDRLLGVINLYVKAGHRRDAKEEDFLSAVANTLAGIIIRREAEEALKNSLAQLHRTLNSTVTALAATVETRDPYTSGHQRRVAHLAGAISQEMGFSQEQLEGMQVLSLLHDIGKVAIPAEILSKPGKISEMEFNLIKAHAQEGYEILKDLEFPWPIAQAVLQHHERMDGSGYPQGLKGPDIILEARILAVADVVEAMASHRPYRPALGLDQALEEISRNKGTLYDPQVVEGCVRVITEKGFQFE